MFYQPKEYV